MALQLKDRRLHCPVCHAVKFNGGVWGFGKDRCANCLVWLELVGDHYEVAEEPKQSKA